MADIFEKCHVYFCDQLINASEEIDKLVTYLHESNEHVRDIAISKLIDSSIGQFTGVYKR